MDKHNRLIEVQFSDVKTQRANVTCSMKLAQYKNAYAELIMNLSVWSNVTGYYS